jgi:hypothetical protein
MVIGERFAWGHLPKTGGEATRSMFDLFPGLILFADPRGTAEVHMTFRERTGEIEGKVLAMNIRRLPAWILSREQHKARWGLAPDRVPTPMDSPEEMAASSFPDDRLETFLEHGAFRIDRWLRMERLADDFLAFISEFTDVPPDVRARVLEIGQVNAGEYDHQLRSWFTDEQVERLYSNNPTWAAVEREVYGDVLLGVTG